MKFMFGVLAGVMVASAGADPMVFSTRVGRFEVHTLVENRGQGRSSLLIGADEGMLRRYVPDGTYPSQINAFLIKDANRVILVDTAMGGALFENMRSLGVSPDQIDAILLTHLHGDHFGGLQRDGRALFSKAVIYLAEQERDYWTRTNVNQGAVASLAPYGSRVRTFRPGELGSRLTELLPGITAIASFGHTPGHTMFLLESDGQRLLFWGDIMHSQNIQFPIPDVAITFDTNPALAVAARKRVLDYVSSNKILVAGAHLLYPSIGTITVDGSGYRFDPLR